MLFSSNIAKRKYKRNISKMHTLLYPNVQAKDKLMYDLLSNTADGCLNMLPCL